MWVARKYNVKLLLNIITSIYLIILQLPIKSNLQHSNECHVKYPNHFYFYYFDYSPGRKGHRNYKRLVGVTQHICVMSLAL